MQELVGKLSAVDPEASEALKIVSFFDTLIARQAGLDGLLRGAAVLAGAPAGAERNGRVVRFDPEGKRIAGEVRDSVHQRPTSSGRVWLERGEGDAYPHDLMILERLAFAVDLLETQNTGAAALSVAIDPAASLDERVVALARLRLEPARQVRLIASPAGADDPSFPAIIVPTRHGAMRARLAVGAERELPPRAGLGQWVRADHAPESWEGAVVALRLTTDLTPVVDAADLGAMLILARAYDPDLPHPDVVALAGLEPRTAEVVRVLVESDSIRRAAATLAMHHSTLQAKHETLTRTLGYDPRTTEGRMRYIAAEMLRRIYSDRGGQDG